MMVWDDPLVIPAMPVAPILTPGCAAPGVHIRAGVGRYTVTTTIVGLKGV
jgi:hypothetical protein